ncbi:hypothetical protein AB0K18_18770 [Nonomuraea sp. NPDC049421]|uniref:hypothetical protein n=1 Tax=Nonomuraea sp. NPDC049421 TaxID=3155275 RepID=UPI003418F8AB
MDLKAIEDFLASLGLRLHPDKTKIVDLREGREGLDFLGCHFRARFSGRSWVKYGTVRFYLHRWPSRTAMKRLGSKVRERTDRRRSGTGRNLRAAQTAQWTEEWFNGHGLRRLRGTIRYPKAA